MKKKFLTTVSILSLTLSLNAFAQEQNQQSTSPQPVMNFFSVINKREVNYDKTFHDVLERVRQDYVEEVADKKLYESALDGMLSSLDPHSAFLNEKDFQDMKISTKGEFGGVGLEVTMEKGFVKVISPYEDGPAFKAGIKVGDFITAIDGQVVKGMSISQAVEKLRGKPKSKVKVTVYRESTNESMDLTVSREIIKIVPVKSRLFGSDVGVIKITSFSENTASMVRKDVYKLMEQAKANKVELRGLILDLRWNAGGLLDQSTEVCDLFLEDSIVVSTKGRVPEANQTYKTTGRDITEGLPMAILVNGGSASASEIVAGAFQDNKRALIVGTKSFGKGSVQSVIPMPNGTTAIKLTTARFYTPSGRAIQTNGITPDVVVEEAVVTPVKGINIGNEASLNNHLESDQTQDLNQKVKEKDKSKTTITPSLNQKDKEDYQLLRAVDIVKGMALYSERLAN